MALKQPITQLEREKFREPTANNIAVAVTNPDGTNVAGSGDGAILDGVSSSIKATILDYTNSNPLAVRLTNTDGDYVGAGAGTQYTEDVAAATDPIGTALILVREDARAGSLTTADGDNVVARGNNKGELYVKTTDSDALLTTIDTDTSNISTKIDTLVGAVSGAEMQVDVLTMPTVAVTGTFWQATQPVSLASVPSHAVTNAGTFAVQVDGNALTSLQLIDDAIYATDGVLSKSMVVGAVFDDTSPVAITENQGGYLRMSSRRALLVEGVASGTAINVLDTNSASALTALQLIDNAISGAGFNITQLGGAAVPIGAGLEATAVRVTLPTDGTGVVKLGAGTAGIGKLTANSGVDIGDVDILSIAAGDNNIGNVDIASIAAGTNAIGKLAANSGVDIGDVDVTSTIPTQSDLATLATTHVKKYYTNAGAVTDGIIWSPAAGKRWFITDIFINVSAAATVTLEDDLAAGDSAVWKAELAANSGWSHSFNTPLYSGEDAADLIITTSAGNCYVSITGYEV